MVISIKYSELYSNSYCKVKLFFPYSQCFLIFFEFHKDYYENANMPIKININSDRHTYFSQYEKRFTFYAMANDNLL